MKRILCDPLQEKLSSESQLPGRGGALGRVVTFGNFDGLHLGHRKLLEKVDELARQSEREKGEKLIRSMICFTPHFRQLAGDPGFRAIYSDETRCDLAEETGLVDEVVSLVMTSSFAAMTPEEFFQSIVVNDLKSKAVVIGDDFHFGRKGSGTPDMMKKWCEENGILCTIIAGLDEDGERISSSRIRKLLENGEIRKADRLLGRPYYVEAVVREGKHLGRSIDTPTVNLPMDDQKVIPKRGVYCTTIWVDGQIYEGISNVGNNPTFGGESLRLEMFIFDFHQNLYDKKVRVELHEFIRPEQVFAGAEALKKQLETDIYKTKRFFDEKSIGGSYEEIRS